VRELILGGARSGKSTLALQRAHDSGRTVCFVATASVSDAEMQVRILRHRSERPDHWQTVEAAKHLARTLSQLNDEKLFVIVDCMTLWLSNVLCVAGTAAPTFDDKSWQAEQARLFELLPALRSDIVLVSNEVGLGIVPDNGVARRFRDEQGRLNQRLAACCDQVTLVVAGLPLTIKSSNQK
jgi:adenosylcobinamide kinase/adenosylcobinamide-phosphate guanylyltransferase